MSAVFPTAQAKVIARACAALGHPARMRILARLLDGPRCVGDLVSEVGVPLVQTSHHLGVLRDAGFLENEKTGRWVVYSIRPDVLGPRTDRATGATLVVGGVRFHIKKQRKSGAHGRRAKPKVSEQG